MTGNTVQCTCLAIIPVLRAATAGVAIVAQHLAVDTAVATSFLAFGQIRGVRSWFGWGCEGHGEKGDEDKAELHVGFDVWKVAFYFIIVCNLN